VSQARSRPDPGPKAWLDLLESSGSERAEAFGRLQDLLWGAARRESARRTARMRSNGSAAGCLPPDPDDLARRATASALRVIVAELGTFDGESRFTTWACKFAISAVSEQSARDIAARPGRAEAQAEDSWEALPGRLGILPHERAGWEDFAAALRRSLDEDLSDNQRKVFTAATLAGVPADVLAATLGTSRNAAYVALFEARRAVRARLAADGHHPAHHSGSFSAWPRWADELLTADPGDAGCDVTFRLLDRYVEAELQRPGPGQRFPAVAAHLHGCRACQLDHRGLLAAAGD
jgi:RNA polymerase sigma-70 factor, ECF subfamily